ncbi:MAG: hypothetical protein ACI8ZX_001108 [Planctomycetota bacterium]|jgi:hypothetical protein
MKNKILILALVLYKLTSFGQIINLGTAANFVLFTTSGAVGNIGNSHVTGDVGTFAGAITGFSNIDGVNHNGDATTINASADLITAYNQLNIATPTFFPGPLLGYGQRFFAGVYSIPAAATLTNCLILDAQGDSSAIFIIQIQGAFSTGPSAKVRLINGASACNVFWKVEGAISMGSGTLMRGNLVTNNGAIHISVGDTLEGRALSIAGAITMDGTLAFIPKGFGSAIHTGPNAPTLGSIINYSLFSSNGIVTDNGLSNLAGDVGTNLGSTSDYNPFKVAGTIHSIPDTSTLLCSSDLNNVYNQLNSLPYDIELLYPTKFGNNLVLTPHVYIMNAAAVLTDTLYLDAQGNANGVFVIKINGALTTSTHARVKLINQAQSKNIFWLINGAATINNYSVIRGTVICNNAASILNVGASIDGAIFTTNGNITTTSNTIRKLNITSTNLSNITCDCPVISTLPIELLSFTGECDNQNIELEWRTASEINNDYFSIEQSIDGINWQLVAKVDGAGNSTSINNYSYIDVRQYNDISYYRLKQTDFNGEFNYSAIIAIEKCEEDLVKLAIYPNPVIETLNLSYEGDKSQILSTSIYNQLGEIVYYSAFYQSRIVFENKLNDIYFLHVNTTSKNIIKKFSVVE